MFNYYGVYASEKYEEVKLNTIGFVRCLRIFSEGTASSSVVLERDNKINIIHNLKMINL